MSLDNFIPEVWSNRFIVNLRTAQVYGNPAIINRNYEGDIANVGDTVHITSIGPVTVGDYTKNSDISSPQTLQDATSVLTITQSKYFNFQVDDVDTVQAMPGAMNLAMQEAAYAQSNLADKFIASQYVDISPANTLFSDATPLDLSTSSNYGLAYENLVDLDRVLDEADVPLDQRWVVVPPRYFGVLLKDQRFVSFGTGNSVGNIQGGIAGMQGGMIAGLTVYKSNNVPTITNGSSQTVYQIIAGHPWGWSFANQVGKIEAYRPEKRFADAVKGLQLYGGKVVRPDMLALLKVRFA